jgi:hypothetical protein
VLLAAACFGRTHLLQEGRYALTATEVLRDDCGLLASPEALWDVELRLAGDVVQARSELLGLELAGLYQQEVERFVADGSAEQVALAVRGRACVLERLTLSLAAATDVAAEPVGSAFSGTVRLRLEHPGVPECACALDAVYRAVHEPTPPQAQP